MPPAPPAPRIYRAFCLAAAVLYPAWGLAFGLAIAKGIVDAHGGAIGVDSTVGAGATSWFTLPATRKELPT